MSSVNWIFLKCFYLASTGRTRIWMVFKRSLLLFQFLEYRGENGHEHTHKPMCVCMCVFENPQVSVPLPQATACKTIVRSIFSLYLVPIFIILIIEETAVLAFIWEKLPCIAMIWQGFQNPTGESITTLQEMVLLTWMLLRGDCTVCFHFEHFYQCFWLLDVFFCTHSHLKRWGVNV